MYTLLTLLQPCDFVLSLQDVFEERELMRRCMLPACNWQWCRTFCHLSGVGPTVTASVRPQRGAGDCSAPSKSATKRSVLYKAQIKARGVKG